MTIVLYGGANVCFLALLENSQCWNNIRLISASFVLLIMLIKGGQFKYNI
ncbi:MAG: hypothetical protein K0R73_1167 [Candidatus Midichloriaceae bacterium]|jgi:hypothetical protein|nr:hypothetical protein [Candidatus Midichloriaceae bacterium]